MIPRTLTYCILLPLLVSSSALAQPTAGLPPFGSFSGGQLDTINNANLNVHIEIPIISKAGRGLPFTYTMTYDSSIWSPVSASGASAWTPVSNGWGGATQIETGYVTYTTTQNSCWYGGQYGQYYYWDTFTNFSYHDSGGTPHSLANITLYDWPYRGDPCGGGPTTTATVSTTDGSGYTVTVQAYYGGAYASSAVTVAGTRITTNGTGPTGSGAIYDRNGNELSFATNSGTVTYTDTLNTPVLTVSSSGTLTYKNPSGVSPYNSSYTPSYSVHQVGTTFGCTGVTDYAGSLSLLDSIGLPDGTSYSFVYEPTSGRSGYVTGRIASVTLPTGGTISYQYSGGTNGINCSDGSTPTLTRITPDGTWTYTRSGNTTTIADPQTPTHNQTSLIFQGIYEVQRNVYSGAIAPPNLLKTVDTCYNGSASPCTTIAVSTPIGQISAITSLPGSSTTLKSQTVAMYNTNGLPSEVDQYDYQTNGVWSLLRKTLMAYATLGNGIQNQPSSITVKNSSGVTVAQTSFVYDEANTLFSTSGTPQQVSVSGSRGNATTITSQTSATTSLTRKFTYFDTGNVRTATDVNNAITTYTYGAGISCGNSFVTSTALPLSLSTSATWDANCYGGVQLTAKDANNQTTTTNYTDANFWRPTSVVDPTTATTAFGYTKYTDSTHPAYLESALNFAATSTVDNLSALDGLGRVHVSQRKQSQTSSNYDSVETDYDFSGRPSRVTVPYQAAAKGTNSSTPATTTTYDALNRPKVVTDGGNGTTNYTYTQNDVLIEVAPAPSGENTKRRQLEFDALGRITSVCEVSAAGPTGSCSQHTAVPGGRGFLTAYTYQYDASANSVFAVSQSGQSRTYTNDQIGRMISEQNPESGTVSYKYDSDATCGTSNGDLVKRTDAMSTADVTCYAYDALHRLTAITYPSGTYASVTPEKHFVYDSATVLGNTMANAMGRLVEAYTGPSKTTDLGFSYSLRGEVADVWQKSPNSGGYYDLHQTYWANGLANSLTLSLMGTVPVTIYSPWTYNPDGEGRVGSVQFNGSWVVSGTQYNDYRSGWLPMVVTFGSGDSDTFTFDPNTGRTTQFKATIYGSSMYGNMTWNANGSLYSVAITDPFNSLNNGQSCNHTYDDLGRVSQVNCVNGGWGQNFTYDAFGNIKKSQFGTYTNGTFQPTYDPTTNRYQLMADGTVPTYDANGNLKQYTSLHSYTWDAEGNLSQLDSGAAMVYDALRRRVEQTNASGTKEILYGPGGNKLAVMAGQSVASLFLPLPGGTTAVYQAGLNFAWYRHADWLGSSRIASDSNHARKYDGAYSPHGETYAENNPPVIDHNFTGQNQDLTPAGDLYDFLYREYHAPHGRWISPDPAGLAAVNPANPQSWNRYGYVNGSPLNSVDPLGLTDLTCPGTVCAQLAKEAVLHSLGAGGGVYNSLVFAGTTLGVQNITLWRPDVDGYTAPAVGTGNGVVFWAPTSNADGSLASLDRQETDWSNPADQGNGLTIGVGLAGNADIGAIIAGAEANTTVAGTFTLNRHPSFGSFVSGAYVAYAGQHVAAIPQQLAAPTVLGAYAGDGVTVLISNVGGVAQMKGPFQMWCGNVGLFAAGSSCVSADSGGHFVFQITFGWGLGVSSFSVTTNTPSCSGPGC